MPGLVVTIDRAGGVARMDKGAWSQVVPLADLPRWVRLYRGLWARKPNKAFGADTATPGPWAGFYEDDLRALERALREATA